LTPAVLTDFDDTAAFQNVAELLLNQFADPSWHDVRKSFRAGKLTFKEYQEITFRTVQADRATMQDYVKQHAKLRPYFGDLWRHCRNNNIPMAVVSIGLDFYIEALLQSEGYTDIPIYSVSTSFSVQGLIYEYRHTRPEEAHLGISKGSVVDRFRNQGHHVVFIGDGRSDLTAASKADTVFAHSVLAEECDRQQIPFLPFNDFGDVLSALREYPLNGESFS